MAAPERSDLDREGGGSKGEDGGGGEGEGEGEGGVKSKNVVAATATDDASLIGT